MNCIFKQLGSADVTLLKQLLAIFGKAFNDISTYQGNIPTDRYLESLLTKPQIIFLVAAIDGKVVGGLVAYELEKFEQERKEIYIYDLAVSLENRRKGIATQLIHELQTIAKQRGAYGIYVQADKDDEPAIKLYESLGAKQDVYHFDIPVIK